MVVIGLPNMFISCLYLILSLLLKRLLPLCRVYLNYMECLNPLLVTGALYSLLIFGRSYLNFKVLT